MLLDEDGVPSFITLIEKLIVHQTMEELENMLREADGIAHPMLLVSWCVRSDYEKGEAFDLRVGWQSPEGDYISLGVDRFSLEHITGAKIRFRVPGLPWCGLGRYWLVVEARADESDEWAIKTRIPVELVIQPPVQG